MRNNTPVSLIFEAVFGADDPHTLTAKTARRANVAGWDCEAVPRLHEADQMLRHLLVSTEEAFCLSARRDGRPLVIGHVPETTKEVLRAWADGGYDSRAHYALRWMHGEPTGAICAALRSLRHFQAAGVSRDAVGDLSEAGYDLGELGLLLAEGAALDYALAISELTQFRAPPF